MGKEFEKAFEKKERKGLGFQFNSLILYRMDSRIVLGLPSWDMLKGTS